MHEIKLSKLHLRSNLKLGTNNRLAYVEARRAKECFSRVGPRSGRQDARMLTGCAGAVSILGAG